MGSGTEADYEGKDVRGKIALVSKLPSPNNALAAAAHGAKGMICMSAGKQRHKMIITPVWGTPEFDQVKRFRAFTSSRSPSPTASGLEMLKGGPVRATLVTDCFEGWRKVRLPVAEIRARRPLFRSSAPITAPGSTARPTTSPARAAFWSLPVS